jgi:hypothetical protein
MKSKWENFKKTVKGELSDTATTTKKYFKMGKIKLDLNKINNSLNDTYRDLGMEVFTLITSDAKEDIRKNPKVTDLIKNVNELKKLMKDDKTELGEIKSE